MSRPTLKVTKDFTKSFNGVVKALSKKTVLVGIPADKDARRDDMPIGNAGLLAIATYGSEANDIPPWNILGIGLRNAQAEIADVFKQGARDALSQGQRAVDRSFERAGIIASTACKKVLNEQEGVPPDRPAEATLDSRAARGFLGKKYWLVTGQLRNAITYVVKG